MHRPHRAQAGVGQAGVGVVLTLVLACVLLSLPAAAQDEPNAAERPPVDEGYDRIVDITFPIGEGLYDRPLYDSFFDSRGGGSRTHLSNDVLASKMVPLYAVVSGEICGLTGVDEPKPSYGYALKLCGDDGLTYDYLHINDDQPGTADDVGGDGSGGAENAYAPGIAEGVQVDRGEFIAWVGDSGNSAAVPHLHFQMTDPDQSEYGGRINPYYSLVAAEERGDFAEEPRPIQDDEVLDSSSVNRLAGDTRVQTAVALSREVHSGRSRAVLIVPADSHVEALVAAPLAGILESPILLSGPDGLDDSVIAEIDRLRPSSAYIIGTSSQLSDQIEDDLSMAGVDRRARISAPNRYALSAAVVAEMLTYPEVSGFDQMILALGDASVANRAWPDALSASALASRSLSPILLTRGDTLPDEIADLLTAQRPDRLLVVGGTSAISEDVAEEAAELADGRVVRLAGATRYETSVAVADEAQGAGLTSGVVWVATGRNFPDALAAGPAAAMAGSPLILIDGTDVGGSPASTAWIDHHADSLNVVGGKAAISSPVANNLAG